jgi:uncharacterized membrane protein (DUF4010 family)
MAQTLYLTEMGRITVSLAVGLLIGLEREWAHKDVGLRTFALACLTGTLAWMIRPDLVIVSFLAMVVAVVFLNWRSLVKDRSLEMTTSIALLATHLLGILIGQGSFLLATAIGITMTFLLAWKAEMTRFATALSLEELRSVVLFGLLSFVIYPLLPPGYVDRWRLINLRAAWLAVIVISAIGFVNYILLRLYGMRGVQYTGFLGGLVNSTATVAEVGRRLDVEKEGLSRTLLDTMLLSNAAMLLRNGAILAAFYPRGLLHGWLAVGLMMVVTFLLVFARRGTDRVEPSNGVSLEFPFSLRQALGFGFLFLVISGGINLAERWIGTAGLYGIAFLGGLVSSASTSAALAILAAQGRATEMTAGVSVVLTSMASLIFHIPVARVASRSGRFAWQLAGRSFVILSAGLLGLMVERLWFRSLAGLP